MFEAFFGIRIFFEVKSNMNMSKLSLTSTCRSTKLSLPPDSFSPTDDTKEAACAEIIKKKN